MSEEEKPKRSMGPDEVAAHHHATYMRKEYGEEVAREAKPGETALQWCVREILKLRAASDPQKVAEEFRGSLQRMSERLKADRDGEYDKRLQEGANRSRPRTHARVPDPPNREPASPHRIEPTRRCQHDAGTERHCRLPIGHMCDHLPDGPLLGLSVGFAFAEEVRLRIRQAAEDERAGIIRFLRGPDASDSVEWGHAADDLAANRDR